MSEAAALVAGRVVAVMTAVVVGMAHLQDHASALMPKDL